MSYTVPTLLLGKPDKTYSSIVKQTLVTILAIHGIHNVLRVEDAQCTKSEISNYVAKETKGKFHKHLDFRVVLNSIS